MNTQRILQFILTGLSTIPVDPTPEMTWSRTATGADVGPADDCGMLLTAMHIRSGLLIGPAYTHRIEAVGWDQYANPDATCRYMLQVISDFGPDAILVHAHSFGNSLLCFFLHWVAKWHPDLNLKINLVFGYDPCRVVFPPLFGGLDWILEPAIVDQAYSWYNADPWRCFGVVGTPFRNRSYQTDVTHWEPKLAHVTTGAYTGIPQSPAVRQEVYSLVSQKFATLPKVAA